MYLIVKITALQQSDIMFPTCTKHYNLPKIDFEKQLHVG